MFFVGLRSFISALSLSVFTTLKIHAFLVTKYASSSVSDLSATQKSALSVPQSALFLTKYRTFVASFFEMHFEERA
jgi:hypothetical protein